MRSRLGIFTLAIVAALGSSLVATPADAGHKHKQRRGHRYSQPVHRSHGPYARHAVPRGHGRIEIGFGNPRRLVAPRHISRVAYRNYRPYYHGRVYFRPHRHHHAVYYFPVHTRAGWIRQPHHYCNGDLFVGHLGYRGPRVSFNVRF